METILSREVTQRINEYGDEIELEIIQYDKYFYAAATICPDHPPFKDYFGCGKDRFSKRKAAKKALKELYLQAYPHLF